MNFNLKISLAISGLALLGAGCAKPPANPTQTRQDFPFVSATPTINTSTWKLFSDKAAGLSFKYPATWPTPKFKEVIIDLDSYGSIDLTSQKWLTQNYEGCLKKQEAAFCEKEFNHTPSQFTQMMAFVSGKNSDPKNFHVGCNAIGGEPITRTGNRAIYFCGYDASIENYTYYQAWVINNQLVELRLPLFPYDSAAYKWAKAATQGDTAEAFTLFTNNLEKSLKNGQYNEVLAMQLAEYDAVANSIH